MSERLEGQWTLSVAAAIDRGDIDVPMVRDPTTLEVRRYRRRTDMGWRDCVTGDAIAFWALGPLSAAKAEAAARAVSSMVSINPSQPAIAGFAVGSWHPVWLSMRDGIPNDPLEREPLSGPHGRKGVRNDIIDVRTVTEEGSAGHFVFWSTVTASRARLRFVTGSRSSHSVWADGVRIVDAARTAPHRHEPWGLEDLHYGLHNTWIDNAKVGSPTSFAVVLAADDEQAPRATIVAFDGTNDGEGDTTLPFAESRRRVRWWGSRAEALRFEPRARASEEPQDPAMIAIDVPVPASVLHLVTECTVAAVTSADSAGVPVSFEQAGNLVRVDVGGISGRTIFIEFLESTAAASHKQMADSITAQVVATRVKRLATWGECGLGELSGVVRYSVIVEREAHSPLVVRVDGLQGSAEVKLDCIRMGVLTSSMNTLEIPSLLTSCAQRLDIEVANSLANVMRLRPNAYASGPMNTGGLRDITILGGTLRPLADY